MSTRTFVLYRQRLLPASETFIPGQADSIPGWEPAYLGFERILGISIEQQRLVLPLPTGRIRPRARLWRYVKTGQLPRRGERTLRRLAPRFVHAHFGPDGTQSIAFARRHGLPLVVTFHGYDITRFDAEHRTRSGRYYVRNRSGLFREAKLIIAVSDYIRDLLLEAGAPEDRTVRHYLGIDIPERRPGFDSPRRGLLFVGRLVPNKGLGTVLRALAAWPQRDLPDLVVIGDGPSREALEREARDLRLRTRFLGYQPHATVLEHMHSARVLCLPSERSQSGDSEALGLAALEAQAHGLPVAASTTGGITEAVTDAETGILLPANDPKAWAEGLSAAYYDEPALDRMAIRAFESVRVRFDRVRQSRTLADLYERVATNSW